ncbi:MAG: FCD domain-containing protein, partial [Microbacterium sp.]|uniref:FCD domain-containing protein n=1 Tax=Microbacterium sp. TaxID=51671 RepID=UPI0039E70617
AAALAAARRTPADLRAIRRALSVRAATPAPVEDHVDADIAVHRAIVTAAHSPLLLDLFDTLTPRVRRAMVEMLRIRRRFDPAADHDAHVRLADAVAAGEQADAAARSRAHLTELTEALA